MGADVCHKVAGISVAAVLGSTDFSYVTWPDLLQWEIEKIWSQIVRISYKFIQQKLLIYPGYILICHLIAPPIPPHTASNAQASYFHEIRGQSPYTLNTLKVRSRQSEERIVDLSSAWAS